jgi:hypothetical protein
MALTNVEKQKRFRIRQRKILKWYENFTGIKRKHVSNMIAELEKKEDDNA